MFDRVRARLARLGDSQTTAEPAVGLFVDGPNVFRDEFDVDLDDLRDAARELGRVGVIRLYLDEHATPGLIQAAEARGFEVIVTSGDVDVKLAVDATARSRATAPSIASPIASRDTDFKPVLEYAGTVGVETIAIAPGTHGRSDAETRPTKRSRSSRDGEGQEKSTAVGTLPTISRSSPTRRGRFVEFGHAHPHLFLDRLRAGSVDHQFRVADVRPAAGPVRLRDEDVDFGPGLERRSVRTELPAFEVLLEEAHTRATSSLSRSMTYSRPNPVSAARTNTETSNQPWKTNGTTSIGVTTID